MILLLRGASPLGAATAQQQQWLTRAARIDRDGWIYLHLEGSPQAIGYEYGNLAAREIAAALRVYQAIWGYDSGTSWGYFVKQSRRILSPHVKGEVRAEIDGIVAGMRDAGVTTSRDEMIALNGYMELAWYWWPIEKEKLGIHSPEPRQQSCSSFIATGSMTADGGIVLAHNSWVGYLEDDCNLVLDIVPEKGHRILMQAFAGSIHSGTDFFVTDAGLVGSETTIGGFRAFDAKRTPEFVRMRLATQYAGSIDEWCAVMKKDNNGGYANAWLLGDVNTGEIARLELGLEQVGFEKKRDGFFLGSNVAEDLKLLRFETKGGELDIRKASIARRVRWKQLMRDNAGKVDLEMAKRFMGDHWDSYLEKDGPSGRGLCGHFEVDPLPFGTDEPYYPAGALDAKVVDATMARAMSFAARWGSGCGRAFDADDFLRRHPQYDWMAGLLQSRPSQPWTTFRAGEPAATR